MNFDHGRPVQMLGAFIPMAHANRTSAGRKALPPPATMYLGGP